MLMIEHMLMIDMAYLMIIFSLDNFSQRDYVWNENVISQIPRFYPYSVAWFIFFFALYPMFNVVCRELFPKFYANVAVEKRAELVSYCVCVVHHAVVVPFGMYKVYKDMMRKENKLRETNYAGEVAVIIPFIIGYFLADTLAYAVPKAMEGNLEFIYHHTLGLGLTFTVIYIEKALIIKMCPHMLMCEVWPIGRGVPARSKSSTFRWLADMNGRSRLSMSGWSTRYAVPAEMDSSTNGCVADICTSQPWAGV
jgi:hypothetical protein